MHTTEVAEGVDKYEITKVKYPPPQKKNPGKIKLTVKISEKNLFFNSMYLDL